MKIALPDMQKGQFKLCFGYPLIFQRILSELAPYGVSLSVRSQGLLVFQLSDHPTTELFDYFTGCRGIAGPFPPPLWIRVSYGLLSCDGDNTIAKNERQ